MYPIQVVFHLVETIIKWTFGELDQLRQRLPMPRMQAASARADVSGRDSETPSVEERAEMATAASMGWTLSR